jgi:hypothetical protein
LLPRKRRPLDLNAARGIPVETWDSDSSPASTQRRRRRRWPHSPSQPTPLANPPSTATALSPQKIEDPLLVAPAITRSQQLRNKRNKIRLTQANADDARMISKYLPACMDTIMPQPIMGPDDHFQPPPDFLIHLQRRARTPVPTPKAPSLIFDTAPSALAHNAQQLTDAGFHLSQLLHHNQHTTLHFGSEFRIRPT